MESTAHRQLKRLAIRFLREEGCVAVASEVRCPIARYRVDVAGYQDTSRRDGRGATRNGRSRRWSRTPPRTVLIECKQSRSDFLSDSRHLPRLLAIRTRYDGMRRSVEEQRLMVEEPHLRRAGSSLFPQMDQWDFHQARLPAYRKILHRLQRLDQQIHGETKFHLIGRYQLADRLFIAAPRGMIRLAELPPGWGLLECPAEVLETMWEDGQARLDEPPALHVAREAPALAATERHRLRLLRNIAVAASLRAFAEDRMPSIG